MPADALILLSSSLRQKYRRLVEEKGDRKWGYSHVLDLRGTDSKLPVILYSGGFRDGIHKIQFVGVAKLGLKRVQEITADIFRDTKWARISRLDWCVDISGLSLLDLALYCRLARAQNCKTIHSRTGSTFYLRFSNQRTVYLYDKLRQLQAKGDPIFKKYDMKGPITRIEIQYKGSGLPFRKFKDIERYAELDMLENLSFWEAGRKQEGLTPIQSLAAEGLLRRIDENGLQIALKMFAAQERAYIVKKLLQPAPESKFPDLNELMRKSVRDWLKDRIRFPRRRKRGRT